MGKTFNFNNQRRIGDVGESDFVRTYEELEPKKSLKNHKIDFTLKDGKTVELKTDSYDMEKTLNFFMEQKTTIGKKSTLGGPWRSKEHKVDYFVYYFMKNKIFFWFDPVKLCKVLDKLIKKNKLKTTSILNKNRDKSYKTLGFKIPRDDVKSALIREHKI